MYDHVIAAVIMLAALLMAVFSCLNAYHDYKNRTYYHD